MKKIIIAILAILLLAAPVFAQSEFLNGLDMMREQVIGQQISGPMGSLLKDQRIDVHITLESGEEVIMGVVMEDKRIKAMAMSAVKEPTLDIYIYEKVLKDVSNSDNPLSILKQAMKDGTFDYKAVGFFNKVKFGLGSVFTKIAASFSGSDDTEDQTAEQNQQTEQNQEQNREDNSATEQQNQENEQNQEQQQEQTEEQNQEQSNSPTGAIVVEPEVEEGPENHVVKLIDGGFEVPEIKIKVGDSVQWQNVRTRSPQKAMIIGAQLCREVRSQYFLPGESYVFQFDEPQSCIIVDAIYATQTMKVVVVE